MPTRLSRLAAGFFALTLLTALPLRAQGGSSSSFDDLEQEERKAPAEQDTEADPARRMRENLRRNQEQLRKTVADLSERQEEEWGKLSAQAAAQYDLMMRRMEEQRARVKKLVEQQWTRFQESTNKEWVDYGSKGDTMSKVDFEKGQVEVEVLVPVEEVAPEKKQKKDVTFSELAPKQQERLKAIAEEKVRDQTTKALAQKEEGKDSVLKDQLKTTEGQPVTEKNADEFIKKELAPKMQVEEKPVVAQDGKPRLKVKVKVPMVPDHLKVRAERYVPQVKAAATKYNLDPALVFAVIHTESCFNPMARSKAGALGLMQIVPRTAGNEAYKYLYKEEKVVTPEYLFVPDNNILLGSTYLHMLHTRHYGKVKNPDNRRTLSIAAYNCGPGNVRKTITSKNDVDTLSNEDLTRLVRKLAPKETQEYVPRVQERMGLYRDL
ncbi:MAG: transglycosylase SLT domain-containing protein [Elusimicrobia bacterium]|nr:transglycosylase SLT domain-containing protein [Elusimicrobiota bacterium]